MRTDVNYTNQIKVCLSGLAAEVIVDENKQELISSLADKPETVAIAKTFGKSKLIRELKLAKPEETNNTFMEVSFKGDQVLYNNKVIGKIQVLFKSSLPGELQARLATESAIERFLEYLQKLHQIVVLDESDRHVRVFLPGEQVKADFRKLWQQFLTEVAFSAYGDTKYQLPGLVQTFIVMLNSITLSGRGFSTLDVPILTQEQSNVVAAWYLAVVQDVEKRQNLRQKQIDKLREEIVESDLSDKDLNSKEKDLKTKEEMQEKEAKKYKEYFQKGFGKFIEEQNSLYQKIESVQQELLATGLTKAQQRKLQKQQEKLTNEVVFTQESVRQKLDLMSQSEGNPFEFIQRDRQQNPDKFKTISAIANNFSKTATEQINSTRGDIFSQCIFEMYRLLENKSSDSFPEPLLTEKPTLPERRSPGDDSKEFCYSCGVALDPKTARWQVLRFMFERPSQRRQSASSEGRPHICASCSALAFASPLKVTEESIVLQLEPAKVNQNQDLEARKLKVKDYIRMLTNKEMHLSAGRYIVLASDKTSSGELASQKLGQLQYAYAKVASIFPVEVLTDFDFSLIAQSSQPINLKSRHLIFIKGLMEGYGQSIIVSGKEINMTLGDAVRYVEQDLPYLADYTIVKKSEISNRLQLEQIREAYLQRIKQDTQGVCMGLDQTGKRAKLYQDVAALTGLTYAFAQSLEITAKKAMKPEDVEREVSKLIEKVDDPVAFCYYATLGDEKKTSVQARLYQNPENYFIYKQTQELLKTLNISEREEKDKDGKIWLTLYADDVMRAYAHFADPNTKNSYAQEKDWKNLTYNLKLSLYTRFPELVRKL
jgi:hypothetical protein